MNRIISVGLFTLLFLVSWQNAFGQYTVANTGGTYTDGSNVTHPYAESSNGYGQSTVIKCEGEITSTFNYPTTIATPRPPAIIIDRTCVANTFNIATPFYVEPPDPDNGLGDPVKTVAIVLPGFIYTIVKTSGIDDNGDTIHHYTLKNSPGSSFSETCTPSAEALQIGGSYGSGVSYTATPHSVRILLTGVKNQYTDRTLMIGAKLTATLDIEGISPSGADACKWSVSGGNPFKDYDPTLTSNQYTPIGTTIGFSTTAYFAKPGQATIKCGSKFPSLGPEINISLSADVTSVAPTWDSTTGSFSSWHLFSSYPATYDVNDGTDPTEFRFYTKPNSSGCQLQGSATTPTSYVGGTSAHYDYGQVVWAQKITANNVFITAVPPVTVNNGTTVGLDHSFPYLSSGTGWPAADGSSAIFRDTPGIPGIASTWNDMNYTTTFETYFFYMPPGVDSKYVPLCKWSWSIDGEAQRTSTTTWSVVKDMNTAPQNRDDYPSHMTWSAIVN